MTIQFKKWQIKSNNFGYTVYKLNGEQWQPQTYHDTLDSAVLNVYERRVRTETIQNIIDCTNKASIHVQTARLLQKIEQIKDEMLEVLDDQTSHD